MIVLIDNGHGRETPGKRSPDGRLREYAWAREIARRIAIALQREGIDARLLVPETTDIPLSVRTRRVNEVCKAEGARNVCLVSIHNNAAGADGRWHDARGFAVYVSNNAGQGSRRLAAEFYAGAKARGLTGNRATPPQGFWQASLAMCRDTKCTAVLTENLFQDNREDVAFLLSNEGKTTIVDLHVNAILNYIATCEQR
jgi:N-acetylmuramoyl-L-alanine amidase